MLPGNLATRIDHEYGVVQVLSITFRAREEYCSFQGFHEPTEMFHPCVRLRFDPVGTDNVRKLESAHGKLRGHDPLCINSSGILYSLNNDVSITCNGTGNHCNMEEHNPSLFQLNSPRSS